MKNLIQQYFTKRAVVATTAAIAIAVSLFAGIGNFAKAETNQEEVALSLATMLRSARAVVSKNQAHINDSAIGDKGLSGSAVLVSAKENYKKATGVDVDTIDSASLQGELLKAQMDAVVKVMEDAQSRINEQGVGFKGFLPAVFARLVTEEFRASTGNVADIKLTAPKSYVRNRANQPDAWENEMIESKLKDPAHPNGKHVSAVADKKGKSAYRLILPEYYGDSCLSCHGGPAGELDITGGKKEGGVLGELGGAISVAIYQ